ncbi:hypothetical protein BCR39DRAFT_595008 [Naematelia encephala]|uniref:Amidohydrolase-related domain-containing protein n=1 Tax=Naematelia encephala TaxID=71784 RepID=A0A1Y2AUA5_9TREE|nr:hypothetical protein BCR39DRAFT_595008 [Naematelia encephala]
MTATKGDWPYPNERQTRPERLEKLRIKPWTASSRSPSLVLTNCQVVDPVSGSLLDGPQTVYMSNGVFVSVGSSITSQIEDTDMAAIKVDLKGKYVCPGLIDAHVHCTAVPGTSTMADMIRTPEQLITLRSTFVLREMLARGFTSVRDTGGASKHLSISIAEGLIDGPRLFQCGKALSQTGGHGDFMPGESGGDGTGCCGGHSKSLGRIVDGVPSILKATREELKAGGVASETDSIEGLQYSPEEIRAVTETAWRMGKKMVTAHAYTVEAINHAVENGVRGIEHGNLLDEPTARMMAAKGVYLTPTLSCYGIMVRPPFEDFLPPSGQEKNRQVMQRGLEALQIAEKVGVTVCYGSDLLISMHALQTEEFTVRSRVLTPQVILRQATINPAKMLGYEGKLGVIAQGAIADLIVLDRNPLEDITVLDRPETCLKAVIKEGRLVSGDLEGIPKLHM